MTATDRILPRLVGVRTRGDDRWIARCPAHNDRSPSLSVRHAKDRVLLHCWAGCAAEKITATLGLTLADLYDKGRAQHDPVVAQRSRAAEGLENWRQAELQRCAEDLRGRDALVGAITAMVQAGTISECDAWASMENAFSGYSLLEYKLDRLLHNEKVLDLWRESRGAA